MPRRHELIEGHLHHAPTLGSTVSFAAGSPLSSPLIELTID
jgi:hypothetical protein